MIRPDSVCILVTNSFIPFNCSSVARITRSTPSPKMFSSESVTRTAISTNTSLLRSKTGKTDWLVCFAISTNSIKSLVDAYFEGSFSEAVSCMLQQKEISVHELEILFGRKTE